MATYDASVKRALSRFSAGPHRPPGALLGRPGEARDGRACSWTSGPDQAQQREYALYTVSEVRPESPDNIVRMGKPAGSGSKRRRIRRYARFAGATSLLHRRRGRGQQRVRRAAGG